MQYTHIGHFPFPPVQFLDKTAWAVYSVGVVFTQYSQQEDTVLHNHHDREHDRKSRRHSESRRRWRKKKLKSLAINGGVIAGAVALVFLLDFLVTLREEPPIATNPNSILDMEDPITLPTEEPVEEEEDGVEETTTMALPKRTYAYVGQPITFYFLNLTGYNSLDGIEVDVETDGKGTVYKDRWEYTPQKAETVKFRFTARNKKDKVISEGACTIEVKAKTEKKKLTALVIGDSTISAGYETEYLLEKAEKDGYNLTLLGTQIPLDLNNSRNRHEGRGGWRSEHYAKVDVFDSSRNPFYNPTEEAFDFLYYMESQMYSDVDCVCIQLGINDVFGAETNIGLINSVVPKYFEYMDAMIESIHAFDPDIKVLWHLILPGSTDQKKFDAAYDMGQNAERYKINTYLANLEIIKHAEEMENVYVVPTNAALNVDSMAASSHGAVHPGKEGYEQLAAQLYTYLRGIN